MRRRNTIIDHFMLQEIPTSLGYGCLPYGSCKCQNQTGKANYWSLSAAAAWLPTDRTDGMRRSKQLRSAGRTAGLYG